MHKICTLCLFGLVMPGSAIVVQDYVTAEAAPSAAGLDLDWGYVYNYKGSSAVSVGRGWLLTAGHVADDGGDGSLTIDGISYTQQVIVPHPSADLALIRYDKVLPGYYSLYSGDLPNLSVLMVGYGTTGTVHADYWTVDGSGGGIKRWGSQQINRTYIKTVDAGGAVGLTKTAGFEMDFDLVSTANESGGAIGDSGGGVFYNDGGIWKLAGINSSVSESGGQFDATFAVAMPYYADWIAETIPEPAAMGLMGFGTLGLFLARTKRRRKMVGRSLFPIRGDEPACDLVIAKVKDVDGEAFERMVWLKQAQTSLLTTWSNVHGRCKMMEIIFWNHMVARHERRTMRKKAIKLALKKKAINRFDAFLARIMK